jgi:hypothetical protein
MAVLKWQSDEKRAELVRTRNTINGTNRARARLGEIYWAARRLSARFGPSERKSQRLLAQQYDKMRKLMGHYGIVGADYGFPIGGFPTGVVAPAEWLPWYELALAIARDLDHSLQIVDAPKPGKTAARWRGGREGALLLGMVELELERTAHKNRGLRWVLDRVRKRFREIGKIPLNELVARYYDAKKHRDNTKRSDKSTRSS